MNISEFIDKCREFPTKAIFLLYFNLSNINDYWNFIDWSINTSQDVLLCNPHFIDEEQDFFNVDDEDEAVEKLDRLKNIFYNQMFVLLFSYVEIFINEFIKEIYDAFFKEIKRVDLSSTSYQLLKYLKKDKDEIIRSNIPNKLRFIRNFVYWDDQYFRQLKDRLRLYSIIRNSITHNENKVSIHEKKFIPPGILNKDDTIQINKESYKQFYSDLLNYCIEINNQVVKNNPILKIKTKDKF